MLWLDCGANGSDSDDGLLHSFVVRAHIINVRWEIYGKMDDLQLDDKKLKTYRTKNSLVKFCLPSVVITEEKTPTQGNQYLLKNGWLIIYVRNSQSVIAKVNLFTS